MPGRPVAPRGRAAAAAAAKRYAPTSVRTYFGDVYLEQASLPEATEVFGTALELADGEDPYASLRLGQGLQLQAHPDAERFVTEASRLANDAIRRGEEYPLLLWVVAAASSVRGERVLAVEQLRSAVALGWRRWRLNDSAFDHLRDDPDYRKLLADNRKALLEARQRILESSSVPRGREASR